MAFQRAKQREPLGEAALFEYAVAALARRMRTERELRRMLKLRAEPGDASEAAINAVVARLVELNYLSDTRFAADYTRIRKEGQKFGRRRVQQDLAAKGIAPALAGAALTAAYEGVDEAALAREYIARKRIKQPSGPTAEKDSSRIMGRLLRAGFSPGCIFKVLRQWGVELEEFEVQE